MKQLPDSTIQVEISQKIGNLGTAWAFSECRPRLSMEIKNHWHSLIRDWADSDLPLAIRKNGDVRGGVIIHSSGRKLVVADNSPAQWAFSRAVAGHFYSLSDIEHLLACDEIPFAFATKKAEKGRMAFKRTLSSADNVNKQGWKLCHIEGVGLRTKTRLEDLPIETLKRHFRDLLAPGNHFLVPLIWAGLGELPEVIAKIRKFESVGEES